MDRHIDARTPSENLAEILDQAASGAAQFVASGIHGGSVEIRALTVPEAAALPPTAGWPESVWTGIEARGLPPVSMQEIDAEVAAYRREKRDADTAAE